MTRRVQPFDMEGGWQINQGPAEATGAEMAEAESVGPGTAVPASLGRRGRRRQRGCKVQGDRKAKRPAKACETKAAPCGQWGPW